MNQEKKLENSELKITDFFDVTELQRLQDIFADTNGVASIITDTTGNPVTKPSKFTNLCWAVIRQTTKGCENCYLSDAVIGRYNPDGPVVQPCLSGGLWDAGVSITVGGKHIANWLIGQVKSDDQKQEELLNYAETIGADKNEYEKALYEIPVMSIEKFRSIADFLFIFANQLSQNAYNNYQLNNEIEARKKIENKLIENEKLLLKKTKDLEYLNSFFVNRELRMVELKKEINDLLISMGKEKRYDY